MGSAANDVVNRGNTNVCVATEESDPVAIAQFKEKTAKT